MLLIDWLVVLYQLSTGHLPFEQTSLLELVHAITSLPPTPLQQFDQRLPTPYSDIILKLLAKSPDQRYQSAFGVWKDLKTCVESYKKTNCVTPFELGQ